MSHLWHFKMLNDYIESIYLVGFFLMHAKSCIHVLEFQLSKSNINIVLPDNHLVTSREQSESNQESKKTEIVIMVANKTTVIQTRFLKYFLRRLDCLSLSVV